MANAAPFFPGDPLFLVTGAAGFIGSNLCDALVERGHRVRALDNFSTGHRRNLEHLTDHPLFELVEGDITDFDTCLSACDGVAFALHQAACGSVPRSMKEPLLYERNNIAGTANMMEAAARSGVRRFVYASSSSVYGTHPGLPKVEGAEGAALSPYALTKQVGESYGALYTRTFGLSCVGLRYFNVFGPRQDPRSEYAAVIPRFFAALSEGRRVEFYGDGTQSRDFTYVSNVVGANLRACAAGPEAGGHVFNIACGAAVTLSELFRRLCDLLEVSSEPMYAPERPGDVKHSLADITKARRLLGYEPDCYFEEGLARTVEWYRRSGR